jgi:hypothetical protein
MSGKPKAKKSAGMVLRWNHQVQGHKWQGKPHRTAIIAVAAVLVAHADSDGGECWPSIDTISRNAGVKRNTACDALAKLQTAGMLTPHGKTKWGTVNYTLRLVAVSDEILPKDAPSIPSSIPSSIPRDTQPHTSEVNTEEDEDKAPAIVGVNAASAGTTKPPCIEGHEADHIIATFAAAFDAKWLIRPRGKTTPLAALQPSNEKLRAAIITKIDAGWPINHLIDRTLIDITTNERKIGNLSSVTASILNSLPADLDATARKAIEAEKVAAGAKDVEQATRAEREASAEKVMEELIALDDEAFDIIHEICKTLHPDDGDEYDALHRVLENRISQVEKEHDLGELGHDNINADNFEALGARLRPYYQECIRVMKGQRKNYLRHINKTQRSITS